MHGTADPASRTHGLLPISLNVTTKKESEREPEDTKAFIASHKNQRDDVGNQISNMLLHFISLQ